MPQRRHCVVKLTVTGNDFSLAITRDPSTGIETYSFANIDNNKLVLNFQVLPRNTPFASASVSFFLLPNAVKISLQISNWAFADPANALRVRMAFTTTPSNQTLTESTSDDGNFRIFTLNGMNFVTVTRFLLWAEVDGYPTALLNISATKDETMGDGFFELLFPSFSTSLSYDPNFSIVLPPGGSNGGDGGDGSLRLGLGLGLSLGVSLLVLLAAGLVAGALSLWQLRRRHILSSQAP